MEQVTIRCRAIIIHEGKLLIVKHSHGKNFYPLPGGHLDLGEDPKECMRRELIEELGIEPKIGRLLYIHTFFTEKKEQTIEFFFEIDNGSDYLSHAKQEKTHAHEIDEVLWVERTDTYNILPKEIGRRFKEGTLCSHERVEFLKG